MTEQLTGPAVAHHAREQHQRQQDHAERMAEVLTADEQAAWDRFMAAALTGLYAAQVHGLNHDHAARMVGFAKDSADAALAVRRRRSNP